MIFNTFQFLWLFPVVFAVYYGICRFAKGKSNLSRLGNYTLLLISYAVYIQYKPAFALILLWVTAITYFGAIVISRQKAYGNKKYLVTISVLLTLLPLLFFKYRHFGQAAGGGVAIPLGISFYTFQALGYLWDVYYRKTEVEKNWWDYMLFVAFFPQIASGPISKAQDLLPQIKAERTFRYEDGIQGLKWLLWGVFMKTVVADRLGIYVDTVYGNYLHYSGITCFVATVFYAFQIYADFAGYSLMAIGVGKVMGFNLPNNFNRPYLAATVTEFWRRWHISLTKWLTSYIYIPLGGNRCSKLRCYFNIMVTFLVSGLWHGANWTFVIWGALHGTFQIIEKALGIQKSDNNGKCLHFIRIVITFSLVCFAWIFFRMPTIPDAVNFIGRIFTAEGSPGTTVIDTWITWSLCVLAVFIIFIKDFLDELYPSFSLYNNKRLVVRWGTYVVTVMGILLFGILDASNFIYVCF